PIDVTGRVRRRQRQLAIRRLLLLTIGALLLALLGAIGWVIGWSSLLVAERVEIAGTTSVAPEHIAAAAKVPLGRPLVRIDTTAITSDVMTVPQVKSAKVTRKFPHTVVITVVERTPVVVLSSPAGMVLVDDTARAYLPVTQAPAGIRTATLSTIPDEAMTRDVVALARGLQGPLAEGQITITTRDSVQLLLPNNRSVFLGSVEQLDLKLKIAADLLAAPQQKTVIDVSSPGHPVIR
ncbi:MAG: cell division protein FtsQ/DivIB, partial [Propionibacteriaceae bacterium]